MTTLTFPKGEDRPVSPSASLLASLDHESSNPYQNALQQLDIAARYLELDPGLHEILKHPQRELTVNFPVKMDNGSTRVFTGYRVQHNMARGPSKGGLRYSPLTDIWTKSAPWRCG